MLRCWEGKGLLGLLPLAVEDAAAGGGVGLFLPVAPGDGGSCTLAPLVRGGVGLISE